jgi:cyclic pyranopterin phosphate synthase
MSAKAIEQTTASPSRAEALGEAAPAGPASERAPGAPSPHAGTTEGPALDRRARPLRDLRVSVTDRCNFRCSYCMPRSVFGPGFEFLPPAEILSFEEIARVSRAFVRLGVRKLRLTGGEPLLRRDLPRLVELLPHGPDIDVALTTNGSLLERHAPALAAAGLARVTVSLDSIDDAVFQRMNDADVPVSRVLAGIDAARAAGLGVKVNAVIQRGVNDAGMVDLVRHFKGSGVTVRLIEFMDVGNTNGWDASDVVSAREMLASIGAHFPLEPVAPRYPGEVAKRHRFADGSGELGIIASVTQPFCGDCSRARLSAQGVLYTCLFAGRGHDLRATLRGGIDDAGLCEQIAGVWHDRRDAYSEQRGQPLVTLGKPRKIEMSYIGG